MTALLRQVSGQQEDAPYAVNMEAQLVGAYWVRLTSGVPLTRDGKISLDRSPGMSIDTWRDLVCELRGRDEIMTAQDRLL